jgi:hypothetical protein
MISHRYPPRTPQLLRDANRWLGSVFVRVATADMLLKCSNETVQVADYFETPHSLTHRLLWAKRTSELVGIR